MSSDQRELFEESLNEVRGSQGATDRFDQAVADAIGLNRTDMRCLDVIDREGPVPAGRLADVPGLTTGAITTVPDRLEKAGDDPIGRRATIEARGLPPGA
jgi:DNA-binding MarR family transcriptional regulator